MRLKPMNDLLVVKLQAEEEEIRGIFIPGTARERSRIGEVLAVGPGRFLEGHTRKPVEVAIGDRVALYDGDGAEVVVDGEKLRIVRETNLLGVVG